MSRAERLRLLVEHEENTRRWREHATSCAEGCASASWPSFPTGLCEEGAALWGAYDRTRLALFNMGSPGRDSSGGSAEPPGAPEAPEAPEVRSAPPDATAAVVYTQLLETGPGRFAVVLVSCAGGELLGIAQCGYVQRLAKRSWEGQFVEERRTFKRQGDASRWCVEQSMTALSVATAGPDFS